VQQDNLQKKKRKKKGERKKGGLKKRKRGVEDASAKGKGHAVDLKKKDSDVFKKKRRGRRSGVP